RTFAMTSCVTDDVDTLLKDVPRAQNNNFVPGRSPCLVQHLLGGQRFVGDDEVKTAVRE
ncbi:hypothetical protein L9F63_000935, partial [Diploptera punctata]